MVQFQGTIYGVDNPQHFPHKNYWKLKTYPQSAKNLKSQLRSQGYYFKSSNKKARLAWLLSRCEQGFLSYDAYSIKELKLFCSQRKLQLPTNTTKTTKEELVQCLELGDDNATFERFLDLSAELRNRIYGMHFDTFEPLALPVPPPITEVSHQLRRETLLLFYHTCTMRITISLPALPLTAGRPLITPLFTRRLFSRLPEEYLGHIQRFKLEGRVTTPTYLVSTTWDVDLGFQRGQSGLSNGEGQWFNFVGDSDAAKREVEVRLKKALESIMARDGTKKLRRSDMNSLRGIFEQVGGQ